MGNKKIVPNAKDLKASIVAEMKMDYGDIPDDLNGYVKIIENSLPEQTVSDVTYRELGRLQEQLKNLPYCPWFRSKHNTEKGMSYEQWKESTNSF